MFILLVNSCKHGKYIYNKDVNAEIIERYSKEIETELHIDEF